MSTLIHAISYIAYFIAFVSALLLTLSGFADWTYGRWIKGSFVLAVAFVLFVGAVAILPEGGAA